MRKVVEVQNHSPKIASTRVHGEDQGAWIVGCEHDGCFNRIRTPKVGWRPVDFTKPEGDCIEIRESAPGRRFCAIH
jgi:hypothetical protein